MISEIWNIRFYTAIGDTRSIPNAFRSCSGTTPSMVPAEFGEPLRICKVEGRSIYNHLSVVLNKMMYRPHYIVELVEILKTNVTESFDKICVN